MRHTDRELKEGKNIYTVYLLRCKETGKGYVGQTTQKNIEVRFNYGWGYKTNSELMADIKKYGWKSFQHKIYATNITSEEADKLEQELIDQYNLTDRQFGYNKYRGGKEKFTWGKEFKSEHIGKGYYFQKTADFITPDGTIMKDQRCCTVGRDHKDWVRIKTPEELEVEKRKAEWRQKVKDNKAKRLETEKVVGERLRKFNKALAYTGYTFTGKVNTVFAEKALNSLEYMLKNVDTVTGLIDVKSGLAEGKITREGIWLWTATGVVYKLGQSYCFNEYISSQLGVKINNPEETYFSQKHGSYQNYLEHFNNYQRVMRKLTKVLQ